MRFRIFTHVFAVAGRPFDSHQMQRISPWTPHKTRKYHRPNQIEWGNYFVVEIVHCVHAQVTNYHSLAVYRSFFSRSLCICCSSLQFVRDYRPGCSDVKCKKSRAASRNKMFIFGVFGHRVRNQKANHNCSNIVLLHHPTLTLSLSIALCVPRPKMPITPSNHSCAEEFL